MTAVGALAPLATRDATLLERPLPDATPAIALRDLRKSFPVQRSFAEMLRHPRTRPRVSVLRGIDLDVRSGELFGLLGLNGAGKTTLLKILATLVLPETGTAIVEGLDVADDAPAVRERVAMVTADERSLHWRLSARENLRLFVGLHRMRADVGTVRIAEALAAVALTDTGEKLVGTFSSGMRQRLLVARALLSHPRVLLLDEPTRSLDPLSAHEFRGMIRDRLVVERGATVVLATHNAEEAFTYCDRVAVLHHGSIAALGSANALASRYAREQYRVATPTPGHQCFSTLSREGRIRIVASGGEAEVLAAVTCEIDGGEEQAAEVLRRLVEAGVSVSRFERIPLALSALISRIAAAHEASVHDGGRHA